MKQEKKIKKTKKNYLSQLRLICQTPDQGHESEIT
jgi:hypothetical protein